MNPNSQNQRWSRWTFIVVPQVQPKVPFEIVRTAFTKFARETFGTATAMRVEQQTCQWIVQVRTEGHPAHDPAFVDWMSSKWQTMFQKHFNKGCVVTCDVRFEAGSRQDGTAPDQLILLPSLRELLQGESR